MEKQIKISTTFGRLAKGTSPDLTENLPQQFAADLNDRYADLREIIESPPDRMEVTQQTIKLIWNDGVVDAEGKTGRLGLNLHYSVKGQAASFSLGSIWTDGVDTLLAPFKDAAGIRETLQNHVKDDQKVRQEILKKHS